MYGMVFEQETLNKFNFNSVYSPGPLVAHLVSMLVMRLSTRSSGSSCHGEAG